MESPNRSGDDVDMMTAANAAVLYLQQKFIVNGD
jgi:hypothetical protein